MKFTCDNGHEWNVRISLGAARRLSENKIIELVDIKKFEDLVESLLQPKIILNILWELVRKQAEAKDLDQETFEDGIDACLKDALAAVQQAAVAFIQDLEPNTGVALEKGLGRMKEAIGKRADVLIEVMESEKMEETLKKDLEKLKVDAEKTLG